MRTWNWTITGPLKVVWAVVLRRPCRGEVNARTKSEARAMVKQLLGVERLPESTLIY